MLLSVAYLRVVSDFKTYTVLRKFPTVPDWEHIFDLSLIKWSDGEFIYTGDLACCYTGVFGSLFRSPGLIVPQESLTRCSTGVLEIFEVRIAIDHVCIQ